MSFEEFGPIVLKAGLDLGVKPKGIIIGFAVVDVECAWVMYANSKVPESFNFPHERVGSDGLSVGLFQQQVVGPPWWWGDCGTCMDPYKSAVLFFSRLKKLPYEDYSVRTPGFYAQSVQGSAFPERYDQKMVAAGKKYDSLNVKELLIPGVNDLYV